MGGEQEHLLSIRSDPDENGDYHLVLELDADEAIPLSLTDAVAWVQMLVSAAATAEHEAALVRQCRALGMPSDLMGTLLGEVRSTRTVCTLALVGIDLDPGVSAFTGKAFIALRRNGTSFGQWSPSDARDHAMGVLMAVATLDLDSTLYRGLVMTFDVERNTAINMISDLSNYRD